MPPCAKDGGRNRVEVAVEDGDHLLGLEPLRQRREAAQVTEQHGRLQASALQPGRRIALRQQLCGDVRRHEALERRAQATPRPHLEDVRERDRADGPERERQQRRGERDDGPRVERRAGRTPSSTGAPQGAGGPAPARARAPGDPASVASGASDPAPSTSRTTRTADTSRSG